MPRPLEYAWDQAQERGDTKAMSAIFDNSLIFVDYDGKVLTKAEYLARVKSDLTHTEQVVTESMDVHVLGNADSGSWLACTESKESKNGEALCAALEALPTPGCSWVEILDLRYAENGDSAPSADFSGVMARLHADHHLPVVAADHC